MRTKILPVLLALVLMLGMLPASVFAVDLDTEGYSQENILSDMDNDQTVSDEAVEDNASGNSDPEEPGSIDAPSLSTDVDSESTETDAYVTESTPADADGESAPQDSTTPESTPAEADGESAPQDSTTPESTPADPDSESDSQDSTAPESTPADADSESGTPDSAAAESETAASDDASEESKAEESEQQSEETLLEEMAITEVSVAEGYYTIASFLDTSFVLDIYGGRVTDGTNVDLYSSNNSPAQVFKITPVTVDGKTRYTIRPVSSQAMGLAVNADSMDGKAQANVLQKSASTTDAQLWYFSKGNNGGYRIHSNLSDKYTMQVYGGTAKDKANVHIYKIKNTKEQEWKLTKVGGGSVAEGLYTIRYMKANGKVLDIYGNRLTNNANVQIYTANGSAAQKFWVEKANEKYRRIRGYASGMSMDVDNATYQNGTNIRLFKTKNLTAQKYVLEDTGAKVGGKAVIFIKTVKGPYYVETSGTNVQLGSSGGYWLFEKTSETQILKDGVYSIRTALKSTMAVDIYGGRLKAGTTADIYQWNASNAQKFQVKYSSGKTTMMALQSGMYLTNKGGTVKNKNKITQQSGSGTAAQWKLVPTGDGTGSFYIQYAANTNYQMDVYGGRTANLTALQIYEGNGTTAQKFIFKKTSTTTGWQNYLGKYRYVYDTNGNYYTNTEIDGYYVDADGVREKIQDREVRLACKSVVDQVGADLYSVYKWCVDNITYVKDDTEIPDGYTILQAYPLYAIENHQGNCYHHSTTFCALARYLGYDAHVTEGEVPSAQGGLTAHSWVEIDINGSTYVFDTQFEHQYNGERNGYYFTYGTSGTWVYYRSGRLN